ncbi:MAG: methyltransferase family protein [bacterium]
MKIEKSFFLVVIQFTCLGYLLLSSPWLAPFWWLIIIQVIGLIIGVWSVISMNARTLNVFPDVREKASLVKKGPYGVIRHPMYLSICLFTIPLLIAYFNWIRLVIMILLLIDIFFKIHYEEKLLAKHFPGYTSYKNKTWKMIPFLY